ncbi:MAG: hypothetical protein HYZ18_13645 [Pseudogulbenkiania sp.]|nr:hypothetical protein [Pseudogulbenkiania sp.]
MPESLPPAEKRVRHFRQILVWPLQLMPIHAGSQIQKHWELLQRSGEDNPWREVDDAFPDDPARFHAQQYHEFITFLPHVQRFLYGESRTARQGRVDGTSPMRVFRRHDIAAVRLTPEPGGAPLTLQVARVDLHFFFDIDVVQLAVEVAADDLTLFQAQDTLYRFGRAYPAGWDEAGQGVHCLHRVEWLAADGGTLAVSDFEKRDKYLSFVGRHRAPCIAAHWDFLLRPLVLDHADEPGLIRYRQLEYYRMPVIAYLAVDNPRALSRSDFIRLGLLTGASEQQDLPYADRHVADFELRYCYDRYWGDRVDGPPTRFLCCGHALVIVGDAASRQFSGPETGLLAQFRHQYFLLFLIVHFQKASLLMFSDRLVEALNRLDIHHAESVKEFKRVIRQLFEIFLRFTHRYWFHELSDLAQSRALYRMCVDHLGSGPLFDEVRDEIREMSEYLDSDSLRRQANTVVRLTMVTTFGLIGSVTTGFLGMNLIAAADSPLSLKLLYFLLTLIPTTWLTLYTVVKSKRLSDFLEALSDERLPQRAKLGALLEVWRRRKPAG